jgi:hypothetical protein
MHRTDGCPAVPREQVPGDVVETIPLDCVGIPVRRRRLVRGFATRRDVRRSADDDAHAAGSARGLAAESFSFGEERPQCCRVSAALRPRISW